MRCSASAAFLAESLPFPVPIKRCSISQATKEPVIIAVAESHLNLRGDVKDLKA